MGKKKQPQNEFYFFMVEKKPEVERRLGRIVKMSELPQLVYAEWTNMCEEKKRKYKEMKEKTRETTEKLDCRGIPLSELKRQEEKQKVKIASMKKHIVDSIHFHQNGGALHHLKIFVASTSYYVCTDEGNYSPAEISVAEFCFEKGIKRDFHAIFKPEIPVCYAFSTIEHSNTTHKLYNEDLNPGSSYEGIVADLKQFVQKENGKNPPLYTLSDQLGHTERILADLTGEDNFSIYSLDYFFQVMFSNALKYSIPEAISTDKLTHCGLDYHPDMACEWHKTHHKDAGKYCTLSYIRRWMYNMCDNILLEKTFGITPVVNVHLPRAVGASGELINIPKPMYKEEELRELTNQGAANNDSNQGFSFYSTTSDHPGASAFPSPSRASSWSTPTPVESSPSNTWSRTVAPAPSFGAPGAVASEEEFPALGARMENLNIRGRSGRGGQRGRGYRGQRNIRS